MTASSSKNNDEFWAESEDGGPREREKMGVHHIRKRLHHSVVVLWVFGAVSLDVPGLATKEASGLTARLHPIPDAVLKQAAVHAPKGHPPLSRCREPQVPGHSPRTGKDVGLRPGTLGLQEGSKNTQKLYFCRFLPEKRLSNLNLTASLTK